ncbi:MAG: condensation domain-containing protein [Bacteroidota bacterium]
MKGDIAIIGMAGRFPQAPNLTTLYHNLRAGKDATRPVSTKRKRHTTLDPETSYKPFSYIEDIDQFDHRFFNISLDEAEKMDPRQRLVLEEIYKAIESSGYPASHFWDSNTAVFMADSELNYHRLAEQFSPVLLAGNLNAATAGRIARHFKLRGAALMVDTACSSSLVALHLACKELRSGDAEMAFVASANLKLVPNLQQSNIDIGTASDDGRTCSFSVDAKGSGSGEAVISVLLKPLEAAQRDNDTIYALIKGSAVNQDAHLSGSLTAPSSKAQKEVLLKAWANAGIDPMSLGYIEAHGSATRLGDPIEIDGLNQAFREFTDQKRRFAVSSVKSNIGHTDASAGLSGLVKAVLSLQHQELFPSINFSAPNPFIDFDNAAVYVNQALQNWETEEGQARRAGVSSFGLSGTNCHVVLEEAPAVMSSGSKQPEQRVRVFPLSAKSKLSLAKNKAALAEYLQANEGLDLDALSYTLSAGRDHYAYRNCLIASDRSALLSALAAELPPVQVKKSFEKLVLVFSDELESKPEAMAAFADIDPLFKSRWEACWELVGEGERSAAFYHFAFQYSYYGLLAPQGVETEHLLGIGIGDDVVEVLMGECSLAEGLRAAMDRTPVVMEDLKERMTKLIKREVIAPTVFLNIGPASTISDTLRQIKKKQRNARFEVLCIDQLEAASVASLLKDLYLLGFPVGWSTRFQVLKPRRLALPPYQFDTVRCWLRPLLDLEEAANGEAITETPKVATAAPKVAKLTELDQYNFPDTWTDTQQKIGAIWIELLKYKGELSLTNDFYKIGGQSLYTIQMMNRIKEEFEVELDFRNAFELATIERLAEHVEMLMKEDRELEFSREIQRVPLQEHYAVSRNQARLWFLDQMEGEKLTYLLSAFNMIKGRFNFPAMEKAFESLFKRHETLRTVFLNVNGEPRQKILDYDEVKFKLEFIDIRHLDPKEKERVTKEHAMREYLTPINLSKGPMLRAKVLQLEEEKHAFIRTMHHIVSDGWSLDVLVNEAIIMYAVYDKGLKNPFPPLKVQYKDYAAWNNKMMSGTTLERNRKYWMEHFKGELPESEFPLDFARPAKKTWKGANFYYILDAERSQKVKDLAQANRASLFMVLFAGIKALYYRYTNQSDVVMGTVISARNSHNLEHQIGFYTNTLPVRTTFDPEGTFEDLLHKMKDSMLGAYDHQWYPYDQLIKDLKIKRKENRLPLFNTSVELRNTDDILGEAERKDQEEKYRTDAQLQDFDESGIAYPIAKYDLTFRLAKETENRINIYMEYNVQLYKKETIKLILDRYLRLLEIVAYNPKTKLKDIPLFDEDMMSTVGTPDTDQLFDYTF